MSENENTLDDLNTRLLAWLAEQPGVANVEDVHSHPGECFGGFVLDGVPVSLVVSYTQ